MAQIPQNDRPVLILGGGAWGLSTALHMNRQGYSNITVLERAEEIPSVYSAAWDLNKIIRAEYEDPFYTDLALKAIDAWKTPLFGPYFHQTSYVVATTGRAPEKAVHHLQKALSSISDHPTFAPGIVALNSSEDFKAHTWQYTGPLTGFRGYLNRLGGYAHSADALKGIWQHCAGLGIRFVLGENAGKVTELLYEDSAHGVASSPSLSTHVEPGTSTSTSTGDQTSSSRCIGAKTADGKTHLADVTICALGAHGPALIPSMANFIKSRCWSVAHVQLTESECDYLRGIPTTNVRDLGFFFEPDPKTRLFKLCPLGTGFTNTNKDGASLPPPDKVPLPQDYIPLEDERKLRQLLRETFPWMADRPFVQQKLCWFADSADSEYCIDFVPDTNRSLVVLSGDSGHGFKMMPTFGEWVVELLRQGEQKLPRWQWRTKDSRGEDWGTAVSWRIGTSREISDIVAEQERTLKARL